MGKGLISFLFAIGATAWIYNKFMRTTGGLTQRSVVAAGFSGLIIFLFVFLLLSMLDF